MFSKSMELGLPRKSGLYLDRRGHIVVVNGLDSEDVRFYGNMLMEKKQEIFCVAWQCPI